MNGPSFSPAEQEIRRQIEAAGAIPFAQFMELALFHPEGGYYCRPAATTGTAGDFSTSPDISPAFGRRIAVQAAEVFERLGRRPWRLVELGPGRGLLAADLLDGLHELAPEAFAALEEVVLVERSPSLLAQQQARLTGIPGAEKTRWSDLDQLPDRSIRGFVFGNEFLDALPVHWVLRTRAGLAERWVTQGEAGELTLVEGPLSRSELNEEVSRFHLCQRIGDQTEVCLQLRPVLQEIARILDAGAVCFIDYGHPASRLADEDHADGTLLAYFQHRVVTDLLARPGFQDLTAHVNWDHLDDSARFAGFQRAGRTTQDRFLLALGLLDDLTPTGDPLQESPAACAQRLAARALILPGAGGGRRFEAALFVKGIAADLRGLSDPFAQL